MRQILKQASWTRNSNLIYGGQTPLELTYGRCPPAVIQIENLNPGQLTTELSPTEKAHVVVRQLARKAHLETRQRVDLRRDLASRLRPSEGPFQLGQGVWYWKRDPSKIRGGEWMKGKIVGLDRTDDPI